MTTPKKQQKQRRRTSEEIWEELKSDRAEYLGLTLKLMLDKNGKVRSVEESERELARLLLRLLDIGTVGTQVYLVMCLHPKKWTCSELVDLLGIARQHVNRALHELRGKQAIRRYYKGKSRKRYLWQVYL